MKLKKAMFSISKKIKRVKYKIPRMLGFHEIRMISIDQVPKKNVIEHVSQGGLDTADSLIMPFIDKAAELRQRIYQRPSYRSVELRDIIFCAKNHMLLNKERQVIEDGSSTERTKEWFEADDIFDTLIDDLQGTYSCIRSLRNNYYHSIIDNLPRLFLMHHSHYADKDIQVIFPGGPTEVELFFWQKLSPNNVRIYEIPKVGLYRCEEYIFTEFLSRRFSAALPAQYLDFFRSRILPDRPRHRKNKIIISRKKAGNGRNIINEEELEYALEALGFKSYILEDLSLDQQIDLFYDATAVVAPHGAGLSNLLFSHDVDVLELHPNPQIYPHFYFLSKSMGHRYQYWCGNQTHRFDAFRVHIPAVLALLQYSRHATNK